VKRPLLSSVTNRMVRPDIEQMRLITKAARLHYVHGERQAEIAGKMGISQASVSRFLSLAEEHGIVRTIVVPPEGLYPNLEDGLVEAYGLDAAYVVDISSSEEGVSHILGTVAARCLSDEFKDGPVLGLTSWSTTLREMARTVEPRGNTGIKCVVEMLGDLGSPMLQHEAALATSQMAKAVDAEAVFLRTPGVMPSAELLKVAIADVHIQAALRLLDKVDIAFVGVGPADFHGPLEEGDNFFTAEQLAGVRAAGAVGQLHQRFIDARGNPVKTELDNLVVGITLDQLRNARRKIAVAGGAAKHQALAAVLAGKWIDILVTDMNSANYLMANSSKGKT
jgi:DNA-binding transcriptional regulator LsrR (DeoR family)